MATHPLEPAEHTLHGYFSRDLPPVLTVDSGDTVRFRTLDNDWGLEPVTTFTPGVPAPRQRATPRPGDLRGHCLVGPVAIRGAAPGMTLAVHIESLRPGAWGYTWSGGELAGGEVMHRWTFDTDRTHGCNQHGHRVALRPFMGVMGLAPAEPGQHSTIPPRLTGGNIDCRELVAGSTLYLPIAVAGGLFSVGDGHALQGDGEVSQTAIECPMDQVTLSFELLPGLHLASPRAHTPAGWLTFGFDPDLNRATRLALDDMLSLMGEAYGLARPDALALASLVVSLRITQIVNDTCGVHAILPHGAIQLGSAP